MRRHRSADKGEEGDAARKPISMMGTITINGGGLKKKKEGSSTRREKTS